MGCYTKIVHNRKVWYGPMKSKTLSFNSSRFQSDLFLWEFVSNYNLLIKEKWFFFLIVFNVARNKWLVITYIITAINCFLLTSLFFSLEVKKKSHFTSLSLLSWRVRKRTSLQHYLRLSWSWDAVDVLKNFNSDMIFNPFMFAICCMSLFKLLL